MLASLESDVYWCTGHCVLDTSSVKFRCVKFIRHHGAEWAGSALSSLSREPQFESELVVLRTERSFLSPGYKTLLSFPQTSTRAMTSAPSNKQTNKQTAMPWFLWMRWVMWSAWRKPLPVWCGFSDSACSWARWVQTEMMKQITSVSVSVSTSRKLTDTQRSDFPPDKKQRQADFCGKEARGLIFTWSQVSSHTVQKEQNNMIQITYFYYWLCCLL